MWLTRSHVSLTNVTVRDSVDLTAYGHGLWCDQCLSLSVANSTFHNLTSLHGPAIKLERMIQAVTTITHSTFSNNTAIESAGAMRLDNAGTVYISHSDFIGNKVEGVWRF